MEKTTDQLIADFAEGLVRQNKMILDNVGISIDMASLPTWGKFASARLAFYGHGRLGRFWCQRVRLRLQPEKHRRLREACLIEEAKHRHAFMSAVLEMGEKLGYIEGDE